MTTATIASIISVVEATIAAAIVFAGGATIAAATRPTTTLVASRIMIAIASTVATLTSFISCNYKELITVAGYFFFVFLGCVRP